MSTRFVTMSLGEARAAGINVWWVDDDEDFGWCVVDIARHVAVGHDGGAPADQCLVRDWEWVPYALNAVASELSTAEDTVALLREALSRICAMAGSHTVPIPDTHPAAYGAIYRTAAIALEIARAPSVVIKKETP